MKPHYGIKPLDRAALADCAAIVDETSLFQRYGYDGDAALRQLGDAIEDASAEVLVATNPEDGRVVGFAWLACGGAFGRSAYLRLIAVAQSHHQQGVGSALMDEIERRHLSRGGIVLLATDDNGNARHFYESRGYRHVGTLDDYVVEGIAEQIYFKAAQTD